MAEHLSAEDTVTTTRLARLLLLSERRIQQLVRAGTLRHAVMMTGANSVACALILGTSATNSAATTLPKPAI